MSDEIDDQQRIDEQLRERRIKRRQIKVQRRRVTIVMWVTCPNSKSTRKNISVDKCKECPDHKGIWYEDGNTYIQCEIITQEGRSVMING